MKQELEGVVAGSERVEDAGVDWAIVFRLPDGPALPWKLRASSLDLPGAPKLAAGDRVRILWDDAEYSASLISAAAEPLRLTRDFGRSAADESCPVEKIDVLECPSCGGAVPLGAGEIAECGYCAARIPLAGAHLDAVRLSARIRRENEKLFAELSEIFASGLKPGLFKALSVVPLALLCLQILIVAYGTFFGKLDDFFSDEIVNEFLMEDANFALSVVLPSLLLTVGWVFVSRRNALAIDVRHLVHLFAPTIKGAGALFCRGCEAPLKSVRIPDLVVCPHCRVENLVMGSRPAFERTAAALKLNHLADMRILHGEFKRSYNKFFVGLAVGLVVLYGSFFAFTCFWDDLHEVHFIVRYVAMPFVVLVLGQLLTAVALLPFQGFDEWLPKYFKESLAAAARADGKRRRPLATVIVPAAALASWALFVVTLFFMR